MEVGHHSFCTGGVAFAEGLVVHVFVEGILEDCVHEFQHVDVYEEWLERQRTGSGKIAVQRVEDDEGQETDWDEEDGDEDEELEDVEMSEAPQLIEKPKKEKAEPEVDEDGFTKVVARRKM